MGCCCGGGRGGGREGGALDSLVSEVSTYPAGWPCAFLAFVRLSVVPLMAAGAAGGTLTPVLDRSPSASVPPGARPAASLFLAHVCIPATVQSPLCLIPDSAACDAPTGGLSSRVSSPAGMNPLAPFRHCGTCSCLLPLEHKPACMRLPDPWMSECTPRPHRPRTLRGDAALWSLLSARCLSSLRLLLFDFSLR